jgi:hypothetical protein
MTGADRVIRWSTAGAVVGMAAVASCEHAYALVRAHGEIMMPEPAPFTSRQRRCSHNELAAAHIPSVRRHSQGREFVQPVSTAAGRGSGPSSTAAADTEGADNRELVDEP